MMITTIIKMDDGFFIPKLDGFDDINKDVLSVNIDLAQEEVDSLSYKELKGIATLERYHDKLENQIATDNTISDIQKEFRKEHHINKTLDEYLQEN